MIRSTRRALLRRSLGSMLGVAMSLLLEEAPMASLFQYQAIWGVSNRYDYQPAGTGEMYAWSLKPRGTA